MIVLAEVNPQQSVFSTVAALISSVVALAGLVIFGYLVLDQLRPPSVVERIVQLTIATREYQMTWLRHVQAEPPLERLPATIVRSECSGYLVDLDIDILARALGATGCEAEIEFCARSSHIVVGSDLATARAEDVTERERLAGAVLDALRCGRERQFDGQPRYGVHQLSQHGMGSCHPAGSGGGSGDHRWVAHSVGALGAGAAGTDW